MFKLASVLFFLFASASIACADGCYKEKSVEACVACLKKQGTAGPNGGWRYCSRAVGRTPAGLSDTSKQKR